MPEFELHDKHRRIDKATFAVDPTDEVQCASLLRRWAGEKRIKLAEAQLITRVKNVRKVYRA